MRPATDTTSTPAEPVPLLGSTQVAAWLGMSREQVWRLWSAGRLPGYKLDRHLRFAPKDVHAFLESNYSGARAAAATPRPRRRRGEPAVVSDYHPL